MDHHQTWCIKLSDNVCWHNLLATFDNQPDLMKHFGVYNGPYLAEIVQINIVDFYIFQWIIILMAMFVGLIPWPSSITSQIP